MWSESEPVVFLGDPGNHSFGFKLLQPLQREDEVDVLSGVPTVVRLMSDLKVPRLRGPWDYTEPAVTIEIERRIGPKMNTPGRDQRNRRRGDRLLQRGPRLIVQHRS